MFNSVIDKHNLTNEHIIYNCNCDTSWNSEGKCQNCEIKTHNCKYCETRNNYLTRCIVGYKLL